MSQSMVVDGLALSFAFWFHLSVPSVSPICQRRKTYSMPVSADSWMQECGCISCCRPTPVRTVMPASLVRRARIPTGSPINGRWGAPSARLRHIKIRPGHSSSRFVQAPASFQVGQTACLPCPANTFSVPPAVSLEDCRCKKGYFSPVYDASQTYGKPGYACVACHTEDFTKLC